MKRLMSPLHLMGQRELPSTELGDPDVDPRTVPSLALPERRVHRPWPTRVGRRQPAPAPAALLVENLQACIDRAAVDDAPVALLLVVPEFRRSTGQALPPGVEARLLHALIDTLETWLLNTDVLVEAGNRTIAIILPGANAIGAEGVAHKVARRLGAMHALAGRDARVRAQIGFSMFPDEETRVEALIRRAQARTEAKRKGGAADR